jgi:tRNA 2-selenouridine synthase SelU
LREKKKAHTHTFTRRKGNAQIRYVKSTTKTTLTTSNQKRDQEIRNTTHIRQQKKSSRLGSIYLTSRTLDRLKIRRERRGKKTRKIQIRIKRKIDRRLSRLIKEEKTKARETKS